MTQPYTNKTRPKPSAEPPKNDRDKGEKAHAMTCVLDREPIQIADRLSPGDHARLHRELETEAVEIAAIIRILEKLKANREYDALRVDILIECWWRSYHNLWLEMNAELGPNKDRLLE